MARIDKTDSAIGVQRGILAAAWDEADINQAIAVGINSSGLVVKGAGQTGIVGLVIPQTKYDLRVGAICDVLSLGEVVEMQGLAAGTQYYAVPADGTISATSTGNKYIGHTVEADRLIVKVGPGPAAA